MEITNGHAARMRYSRFKAQMEGIQTTPRRPRSIASRQKKPRKEKAKSSGSTSQEDGGQQQPIKAEARFVTEAMDGVEWEEPSEMVATDNAPTVFGIKQEGSQEPRFFDGAYSFTKPEVGRSVPSQHTDLVQPKQEQEVFGGTRESHQTLSVVKQEPSVKLERKW